MRRFAAGFVIALVAHAALFALLVRVHALSKPVTTARIEIALASPRHAPPPTTTTTQAPASPPRPPPPTTTTTDAPPTTTTTTDAPTPTTDAPAVTAPTTTTTDDGHAVGPRIETVESGVVSVIRGSNAGPQPSLETLEGASDIPSVGPESDTQRAQRVALTNLVQDISEHDVARGLAQDWFARRRKNVERTWRPSERELVDGGKSVQAEQLFLRTLLNPLEWREASEKISGDASRVADSFSGERGDTMRTMMMPPKLDAPETDAERRTRVWNTFETHRGAFNTNVGLELVVHHRGDGSVEAIEVAARSGHPVLDDGAADAVARAFALDDDKVPALVARNHPFVTRWALDASWELNVPKCSFVRTGNAATSEMNNPKSPGLVTGCGASFGNDGVDVPFTVKKVTHVELISVQRL